MAGGERCRCTTVSTVTPLIDELDVLLDHDFEASIGPEMRIYGAASNTSGGSQYFTGSYVPDGRGRHAPGSRSPRLRQWPTRPVARRAQPDPPHLLRPSVRPYCDDGVLVRFKVEHTDRPNATIIFDNAANVLDRGGHGEVLANVWPRWRRARVERDGTRRPCTRAGRSTRPRSSTGRAWSSSSTEGRVAASSTRWCSCSCRGDAEPRDRRRHGRLLPALRRAVLRHLRKRRR